MFSPKRRGLFSQRNNLKKNWRLKWVKNPEPSLIMLCSVRKPTPTPQASPIRIWKTRCWIVLMKMNYSMPNFPMKQRRLVNKRILWYPLNTPAHLIKKKGLTKMLRTKNCTSLLKIISCIWQNLTAVQRQKLQRKPKQPKPKIPRWKKTMKKKGLQPKRPAAPYRIPRPCRKRFCRWLILRWMILRSRKHCRKNGRQS